MKSNRILALATGAVLLAGGISAVAFAGPHGGHGGHFGGHGGMNLPGLRMMRLAQSLDLTEEQEVNLVRIRRSIKKEAMEQRDEMKNAFSEVMVELEKPAPDAARLHQLVDEATARMTKVAHSSVDQYLKFHATLTPEQRQTLVQNARQMKERREERRQQFKTQRIQK